MLRRYGLARGRADVPASWCCSGRSRWSSGARSTTAPVTSGDSLTDPNTVHAFKITLIVTAIAVPLNTVFGIVCALAIVRQRFPGTGIVNALVDLPLALSPVVVGLSLFLLYGRTGWFGDWFTAARDPDPVRAAVDGDRDDLRLAAVRRARGRADAARDRRRAGAGGAHARRGLVGDVLADHAAVDPLGGDLRRRADDRALSRRVRRRRGRLRPHRGPDRDGDPARPGPLRELRRGRARTGSRSCSP